MTEKERLRQILLQNVNSQRQNARVAADSAHDDATHEQSVAETQYDTVGLEAAYLAHGQSQRVADYDVMITRLQSLVLRDFDAEDEIAIGSIVTLDDGMTCWLLPVCGGNKLESGRILVITPQSPLGQKLKGAAVGEKLDDGRVIIAIR